MRAGKGAEDGNYQKQFLHSKNRSRAARKSFFLEVILIFSSTLHLTVYKLREAVPELLCAFLPTTPFPIPPLPTPFGYDP